MKVIVVGGCGHVGLPFAVSLANAGLEVVSYDIDSRNVELVNLGKPPFLEDNLEIELAKALRNQFSATSDAKVLENADIIVMVIGTPIDENSEPENVSIYNLIDEISKYINSNQLLILRSTVLPGSTNKIVSNLAQLGKFPDVSFCPERIIEGKAIEEIHTLPQIIGANTDSAYVRSAELFAKLGVEILRTTTDEAELAKLVTNTWRYIKFATVNEFWMIASNLNIDFQKVRNAVIYKYPRASDLPSAGFTAGPCLFKDTKQLIYANGGQFQMGSSAIEINTKLPHYLAKKLSQIYELSTLTVGILGMAFKGDTDDIRTSLSYVLKKNLLSKCKVVLTHDPYVKDDQDLVSLELILLQSDLLIIAAPHRIYKEIITSKPVIDIWNLLNHGAS